MKIPRKNSPIQCLHFKWILIRRNKVWYADGRGNTPDLGRHSLGTKDEKDARRRLPELDQQMAEQIGKVPRTAKSDTTYTTLSLKAGRTHYEKHITRPREAKGVRKSTAKRYRTVFDKFELFAAEKKITSWNQVNTEVVLDYLSHLEMNDYAPKTLLNEVTVLKQAHKWLMKKEYLVGTTPIDLQMSKVKSEPAYCYRTEEINAMLEHCRSTDGLAWLGNVILALACTGLRIAELASLRWGDFDLTNGRLMLTDETGYAGKQDNRRSTKSGRSRSFPIHPELLKMLETLPRQDRYVFHGPRGGRIKPDTVRRILIRDVLKPLEAKFPSADGEKGFKDGRLHSFRHAFCSTCANNGVPERMLMEWLGHADSAMVRWYYHLHDDESRAAWRQSILPGPVDVPLVKVSVCFNEEYVGLVSWEE
jgi:integrase